MLITSLHNPRVKEAAKLRERRQRDKQHRLLIDGTRELRRAVAAGVELVEVFVCKVLWNCQSSDATKVLEQIRQTRASVLEVTPEVISRLAFGQRNEGLVGVAKMPDCSLDDLRLPTNPLVAVVEGVEKPGNLGAIIRTADAVGVSAVIAAGHGTDLWNPNVIRASLGTVFTLPVRAAQAEAILSFLRKHGLSIYAARVDAPRLYPEARLASPAALVLGSETAGLTDIWRGDDITAIRLPMHGAADSLNVSATAAVLFYEALRQRAQ